jgi:hypothetical protein
MVTSEHMDTYRPYRPSNGTEGDIFMTQWCGRCLHDQAHREGHGDACDIATDTMAYSISDPEYPKEWRQDGPSGPRCTNFQPENVETQPLDPGAVVTPLP